MAEKRPEKDQAQDSKGKKKLLMIAAIAAIVLIGGGVASYLLFFKSSPEAEALAKAEAEKTLANAMGPMIDVDAFIVNILDGEGSRYLKAALTLEVDSEPTVEEVSKRMPQIKDAILLLVSNKTFGELQDLQGKLQLRAELTAALNELLKSGGSVKQIYFTDFVVQ